MEQAEQHVQQPHINVEDEERRMKIQKQALNSLEDEEAYYKKCEKLRNKAIKTLEKISVKETKAKQKADRKVTKLETKKKAAEQNTDRTAKQVTSCAPPNDFGLAPCLEPGRYDVYQLPPL
jgi:hypothetical protein